jgi:hypothetical protein
MKRVAWIVAAVIAFAAACSPNPERPTLSAIPTAPSANDPGEEPGGVSGPTVVAFPGRADTLDFRRQLETKYTSMGRTPSQTVVDMEGEATWIGEYQRYRVNGCDHDTATRNVMTIIDGGAPPQVCSVLIFPETAVYPPRDHAVDFRRQLGDKYRSMGRSAQSAVDPDGAAIWISEYLRYRSSGCDHATAVQKTMAQVDGGAASESCLTTCTYAVDSPKSVAAAGGNFVAEPDRRSGSCNWVAQSEVSWIIVRPPITGGHRSPLSYTVLANTASDRRTGRIRVTYPGGVANLDVEQSSASHNLSFQFFDPAVSANPTTECQIRGTATICTLNAATTFPAAVATYAWRVEYVYGSHKVRTQSGPLSSMSFTEACHGANSPSGSVVPITVTLTATDTQGRSATVASGQGSQAALQLRAFTCP